MTSMAIFHYEELFDGPSMSAFRMIERRSAAVLLCAGLLFQPVLVHGAESDDVAALKRAVEELKAQNRDLANRLANLEGEKPIRKAPAARTEHPAGVAQRPPEAVAKSERDMSQPPVKVNIPNLEQRVTELEIAKTAQEDSVRSIIQNSFAKTGSKINEFVTFGGSIEVTGGRGSDFTGKKTDAVQLSTAELDFEIKLNDWVVGNLIVQDNPATNVVFPTGTAFSTVEGFVVDRATITIGDVQRFPLFAKVGRDALAFGTSTGVHRADVLSLENPLTIEVFETRRDSIGIGFALPTPAAGPPPQSIIVPPVRPMVLNPAFSAFARGIGYQPLPTRAKAPTPTPFTPEPPPFYGSFNVYDANTVAGISRRFDSSYNGRLGYHTGGHCGVPYDELKGSLFCPWGLDVSVDYISSVFDSTFLESSYNNFMNQFGQIPGAAVDLKMNFGPALLIAEYNTALKTARFVDDAAHKIGMKPAAWQVALGYQFDWNPWVETIGTQGTFVAVGYSRSQDLAGAALTTTAGLTRVGFVPESRLTLTAAEWVLDGLKLSLEYTHNWDYSTGKGGSGREADGILFGISYTW